MQLIFKDALWKLNPRHWQPCDPNVLISVVCNLYKMKSDVPCPYTLFTDYNYAYKKIYVISMSNLNLLNLFNYGAKIGGEKSIYDIA